MKQLIPLSLLVLFCFQAYTQNVGVGTPTPQLKLDVAGAIGSTPGSAAAANSVVIPDNLSIFRLTAVGGAQTNALSITNPQNGQYLTIINEDDNAATFAGTTIPAGAVANFIYFGSPVAAWKQTATSALSGGTGITITNNVINSVWTQTGNDIYNNNSGNVGIGTNGAASQKLQVDNGNMLVRGAGNFTGDAIYYMGDANHYIKSTAGDGVTIGTYSVATGIKLKQSSGNVGIGDANPQQKLNVQLGTGNAEGNRFRLSGQASTDFINAFVSAAGSGELRFVGWANGWNMNQMSANKHLYINRDAPSSSNVWIGTSGKEVYVRGSDGNTGIGTSSPNQKLEIGVNGGLGFSGSSPSLNSADKKLYSPADGDLEWMTNNAAGGHGFAVSHQGTKLVYLNTAGSSYLNGGNVGIGTASPQSLLHVMGKVNIHQSGAGGGQNRFEGIHGPTDANGRAQLVLSSAYSDVVIASSQANDAHGSTLSFVAYNPSNAGDYRKFVINQGNWGARKHYLDFGYSDAIQPNPHLNINSTSNVMTMNGISKAVGIGTYTPENTLEVAYRNGSGNDRATVSITGPGSAQWGNLLMLRTTGVGTDGAAIVFRNRDVKNWIVGGESNGNGFQIREDGGDSRFGAGFGTVRVHVAPGGQVQTRNGLLTERRYNYFSKRIPTNGTSSQYYIGNWDYCAHAGQKIDIGDDAFDGGSDNTRYVHECWVELNDTWPLLGCDCNQPWGWDYGYDQRPAWYLYMYAWCQFDQHMSQHCMAVCVNFDY